MLARFQHFVLRMITDGINKLLIRLIPHMVLGFRGVGGGVKVLPTHTELHLLNKKRVFITHMK